ncbi:MAG: pantetheine-phosphate adenylyltransferase [Clostridia bacterium]|nr:pantetheine-phosphate adenylyltransferase [Clostridia bacterium]
MKRALYAGSFDPITLGHIDIIERASKLFDEVTVSVVINLEKKTMFDFEERMDMVREVTKHLPNVRVDRCTGLLADYVNENRFDVVVRGLRGMSDFDSEREMAELHRHLYRFGTETMFLISKGEYAFISSSMSKQVVSLGGDGTKLLPPYVIEKMKGKLGK